MKEQFAAMQDTAILDRGQTYWDAFYDRSIAPATASGFAEWISGQIEVGAALLDLACGNGRDARFFAERGHAVLALDQSLSAIEKARGAKSRARFLQADVAKARALMQDHFRADRMAVAYGRFMLHAIPSETEAALLLDLSECLPPRGLVAFEYRTLADALLPKCHGNHYRRFIDHADLLSRLGDLGFDILLETEGQGLAPYKEEDPVVGRVLARRNG
ncbi:class I SAM-dependent methyltransferase [Sabulicella rubraurantiaca]|uniref:class I SAM-dependent methyltransferase n=1 Tax=Sabulicella rubraurantiaca TaxID=2811429 RepID=UPI001A974406|nr:class I SAM-dependent methyltransferase [Sabulicella rubraurantiaca]